MTKCRVCQQDKCPFDFSYDNKLSMYTDTCKVCNNRYRKPSINERLSKIVPYVSNDKTLRRGRKK